MSRFVSTACCLWAVVVLLLPAAVAGGAEHFPLPAAIAPNVAFWEKVYGQYSIREGILHDRRHLDLVYGVIPLEHPDLPGASERNRRLAQAEIERIAALLHSLADGVAPAGVQERKLAALLSGRSPEFLRQAADNIRMQAGLKERFLLGVQRSGAYIKEFRRRFVAAGLPAELAYLPHVESSFDPEARSKAGAVGLWQFTRETGLRYLSINASIDERLDPWRASEAATRYLKESYAALGDWPLALTSYNYGRAGMLRAKAELGSYERIFTDYHGGHFKFAARNFYPEFLAAVRVARRLEADPAVRCHRPRGTIVKELAHSMTIMDVSRQYRVGREEIVAMNPALLSPVVTGRRSIPRGYALRLPAGTSAVAQLDSETKRKAEQPPAMAGGDGEETTGARHRHQVRQGETVSSIARRYKVGAAVLIAANRLDRQASIQAGQYLDIPAVRQQEAAPVRVEARAKREPGRNP